MVFSNHPTWLSTRSAFAVWIIPTRVLFCCCILVYFLVVLCLDDYVNLTFLSWPSSKSYIISFDSERELEVVWIDSGGFQKANWKVVECWKLWPSCDSQLLQGWMFCIGARC